MQIKKMTFDNGGDRLKNVTVRLTAGEAALIVRMIGRTTHTDRNRVMPDGGEMGTCVYEGLDSMFNMLYENGVHDVG